MCLQDRGGKGIDALSKVTDNFIAALNKRPEVQRAYTSFSANFPQYMIEVDEASCQRAGITTNNGGVAPISSGPNFYTEVSANAILQPTAGSDYTVVKRDVKASAKLTSYFTCVNIGDVSYATLKAEALKQVPGAQDLVDVKMDYSMKNICGINEVTVTLTGTAVKFNK